VCGLISITDLDGINRQEVDEILEKMTSSISHRGPDCAGYFVDAQNATGHRRLSVIDIDGGQQPWVSPDNKLCLAFNGEIYNHKELREILVARGYHYSSHCDTQTVLFAYQEWGEQCVEHFRGMFAFVIWDVENQKVFAARDRLGLKPLYYYVNGTTLVLASELKALLQHPDIPKVVDSNALIDYLRLGYYPAPQTPLKNVFKLQSGSTLLFTSSGVECKQYWSLTLHAEPEVEEYSVAKVRLEALVKEAVDYRLESDVPIGAFLSGGIDSSIITAYASARLEQPLNTYCITFDDEVFDESVFAREVSDLFGTNHTETEVHNDLVRDIKKILWHMDEPFADDSAIPTYYLCREAKKHMTVALSGDGADELFAGYSWYQQLLANYRYSRELPGSIKKLLKKIIPRGYFSNMRGVSFLENMGLSVGEQHANLRSIFSDSSIQLLIGVNSSENQEHPIVKAHRSLGVAGNTLASTQLVDMSLYLAEDILMKVDKMSMAHGLEVRAPFLDHKLVEYSLGLPSRYKNDGKTGKIILKDIVRNIFPPSIIRRKKQGFSTPLRHWLLEELNPLVEQYLLGDGGSGLFDRKEVALLWAKFLRQNNSPSIYIDISQQIWALLSFELWYDIFILGRED